MAELGDFLDRTGNPLTLEQAATFAIQQWIKAQQQTARTGQGYQWKCLCLPSDSRLRMHYDGQCFYAQVAGDELRFQGRPVSPRQMTIAIAGEGRNAWQDLWIQLPSEKNWTQAAKLRGALQKNLQARPASPAETMEIAAHGMREALQAALSLVDHIKRNTQGQVERRVPRHRRQDDTLIDYCKAD
ncbi:hypothetical protein [Massilia sp. erpn]|uniref:hypothetical protein n=1 Tax=Massilia sp. erpn TaxID=2738142 RepID=UPI002107A400|nr:hypothetical protein [Massilia sp. erpn]